METFSVVTIRKYQGRTQLTTRRSIYATELTIKVNFIRKVCIL